ncbi:MULTISPECIES: hypothetical protein [Rhodomicrobium]|uniref:hypothetical protein n=1 Tax=Rhodomicrobium TaxID=1068 RepID=UPI000B4A5763|nr:MULTISPECIES: hypothetical protein [Rhodomicrobium]
MNLTRATSLRTPDAAPSTKRRLPWLPLGVGLFAGCLSAGVIAGSPNSLMLGLGLSDGDNAGATLFGAALRDDSLAQPLKVLSGVSGETFVPGAPKPAVTAEAEAVTPAPNVAPVGWDRLSGGGCMTVTTKNGQTFSFRILGARPGAAPAAKPAEDLPKVDLAITACPATGEPIAKAVIEPTEAPVRKIFAAEHSL